MSFNYHYMEFKPLYNETVSQIQTLEFKGLVVCCNEMVSWIIETVTWPVRLEHCYSE